MQDAFAENGFRIEVNNANDVGTTCWSSLQEVMHFFLHARQDLLANPRFRVERNHYCDADEELAELEANTGVEVSIFWDAALGAAITLPVDIKRGLARRFEASFQTLRQTRRDL